MTTATIDQVQKIIRSAKQGDRLKLVFAKEPSSHDLVNHIGMLLFMYCHEIRLEQTELRTTWTVVEDGKWAGFRARTIIVDHEPNSPEMLAMDMSGKERVLENISLVED